MANATGTGTATNIGFESSAQKLTSPIQTSESKLNEKLNQLDGDTSPATLANFQVSLNQYTVLLNLTTSINKAIKDSMSSTIQKM